jgi:VWFA-related protein
MRHAWAGRASIAAVCTVGLGAGLSGGARQAPARPPTFRAAADAVRVDVSVERHGRPVKGLDAKDFELRDSGVVQQVRDLSYEKAPIDVTIAFDVSQSVTGRVLDQLRQAVDAVRGRLRDGDRIKLVTFNMRVARLMDFADRRTDTATAFNAIEPAGSTSLFDAIAVALTSPAPADRRQLLVVFSDGQDTGSITRGDVLLDVARHTTATVAFVLPSLFVPAAGVPGPIASPGVAGASGLALQGPVPVVRRLAVPSIYRDVSTETGGIVVASGDRDVAASFARVLDEFRAVYVLHFTPSGTPASGYHELQVGIRRPGQYEIRARRGYFAE